LLIIPINGSPTLSPGGPLPLDTYCYIEDRPALSDEDIKDRPALSGEDIDVVIVAYEAEQ
jgi:hypothetical protein